MARRSSRRHLNCGPGRSIPQKTITIAPFIDSSLVSARSAMSRDQAIRQMASDMREAAHREGGVTSDGLELLGFTPAQIADLVRPARVMANKLAALT